MKIRVELCLYRNGANDEEKWWRDRIMEESEAHVFIKCYAYT